MQTKIFSVLVNKVPALAYFHGAT